MGAEKDALLSMTVSREGIQPDGDTSSGTSSCTKGDFGGRRKKLRKRKVRLSADGTPYTIWQTRTHWLCIAWLLWSVLEIAAGIGLVSLSWAGVFYLQDFLPTLTVGPTTIASGVVNLLVAVSGLWGAYNPRRITFFFWVVIFDAVLVSWATASAWSVGRIDPATTASLIGVLIYAVCAWNVRGQTGYFDNHPHPEDEEGALEKGELLKSMPLERVFSEGGALSEDAFSGDALSVEEEKLSCKRVKRVKSH